MRIYHHINSIHGKRDNIELGDCAHKHVVPVRPYVKQYRLATGRRVCAHKRLVLYYRVFIVPVDMVTDMALDGLCGLSRG